MMTGVTTWRSPFLVIPERKPCKLLEEIHKHMYAQCHDLLSCLDSYFIITFANEDFHYFIASSIMLLAIL